MSYPYNSFDEYSLDEVKGMLEKGEITTDEAKGLCKDYKPTEEDKRKYDRSYYDDDDFIIW